MNRSHFSINEVGEMVIVTGPCWMSNDDASSDWPTDEEVSEWVGRKVRMFDSGDHPTRVECVYCED